MQTQHTPNPRHVAAAKRRWAELTEEQKRARTAKMHEARWGKPKPANGNGQEYAAALDAAETARRDLARAWTDFVDDGVDGSDVASLQEAKRALSNGRANLDITYAIREVQAAILRGEVEAVAEDGKLAFYRVTRERVA